ncbi:DUF2726 domain-containing protein [Oscillospiraceae bacterium MB08-C2-2]|nr:DUF2726 domain-containing protein [Oscillospiraceae bacterium MB08-C2-2]
MGLDFFMTAPLWLLIGILGAALFLLITVLVIVIATRNVDPAQYSYTNEPDSADDDDDFSLGGSVEDFERFKKYLYKKREFLSPNELSFYSDLLKVGRLLELTVFTKVRLADVIEPITGQDNWMGSFNKIKSKHVDFVLCNSVADPVLVVELDDSSHNREDRIERDHFVDYALKSSGVPVLHVFDSFELADKIRQKLNYTESSPSPSSKLEGSYSDISSTPQFQKV